MTEPIEVTAEVVSDEITINGQRGSFRPAEIDIDMDAVEESVRGMLADYDGLTPESAQAMTAKEAKACRADLNRISKQLNDARKAVKKVYNEPLARFEARVREIDAIIAKPKELLDARIKDEEQRERAERYEALMHVYEDYAPALVDVVPFERVFKGHEKWLNKSYGLSKAEEELTEVVGAVASDLEALQGMGLHYPEEAQRTFFETLSLRQAVNDDKARYEQQRRIDAMREEVEANREAMEEPEPMPEPEPVAVYVAALEMTEGQRAQLMAAIRGLGIHGRMRRTNLADAEQAFASFAPVGKISA